MNALDPSQWHRDACTLLQKRTRALMSDWWERKAVELQRAVDRNNINGLKEVWGLKRMELSHLKSTDGIETFSDSKRFVARWSEHFHKLFNVPGDIDQEALRHYECGCTLPRRVADCVRLSKFRSDIMTTVAWRQRS